MGRQEERVLNAVVYCIWAAAKCALRCFLVAEEWRKDLARLQYERWSKGHHVMRSESERVRPYWTDCCVKSRRAGIARGDKGSEEGIERRPGPLRGRDNAGRRLSKKAW